jgi:hypothetical protein
MDATVALLACINGMGMGYLWHLLLLKMTQIQIFFSAYEFLM